MCTSTGCFSVTGLVRTAPDICQHTQTQPLQRTQARLQKDKVHLLNLFNNGQWTNMRDFFHLRLYLEPEGYAYMQKPNQNKKVVTETVASEDRNGNNP